ncbi:hypothetical protein, partial [Brachyspira pulli]|uniref:hypothetical protein n=1 Tax=Brachyspira pulli TaxID=310721 RepID=UPI0030068B7E
QSVSEFIEDISFFGSPPSRCLAYGTQSVGKRSGGVTKYAERWGKATTSNKIEKTKIDKI